MERAARGANRDPARAAREARAAVANPERAAPATTHPLPDTETMDMIMSVPMMIIPPSIMKVMTTSTMMGTILIWDRLIPVEVAVESLARVAVEKVVNLPLESPVNLLLESPVNPVLESLANPVLARVERVRLQAVTTTIMVTIITMTMDTEMMDTAVPKWFTMMTTNTMEL